MRRLPVLFALLIPGCLIDDGTEGDATLGQVEQAVSSTELVVWPPQVTTSFPTFDLGTSTDRVCMIAGIRGAGDVRIFENSGHWYANSHALTAFQLTTVCVVLPNAALTPEVAWYPSQPSVVVAPWAPNRLCFLTGLSSRVQEAGVSIGTSLHLDFQWWLGGNDPQNHAYARCMTVSSNVGSVSFQTLQYNTETIVVADDPGGVACGLSALGTAATPPGPYPDQYWAASLRYHNSKWWLDVGDGRSARATCFQ